MSAKSNEASATTGEVGEDWLGPTELQAESETSRQSWISHIVLLVLILGSWDLVVRSGLVHAVVLPSPQDVAVAFGDLVTSDFLPAHIWATLSEAMAGFVLACIGGFVIGTLLTFYAPLRRLFYPYIVIFYNLPKVALAPLFIAWLGFGASSKIGLATAIAFFPVLINTMVGLQSVPEDSLLLMRSLVAKDSQVFRRLALPWALPSIFAGVKTAMTLALIGAIVAEFVGAKFGLAVLIDTFSFQFRIASVYAVLVLLGALGLVLFGLIEFADRKIVFWRDDPNRF